MEQLKNYLYIDAVGLDSLLAQINSELVEENHVQTTKRKAGTAKGDIGFSELIKKLFKADVSVMGELETVQVIDKKTTQPYEAKIQEIVRYIQKQEVLLNDSTEIINQYQDEKQNFIFGVMPFDTDFDYNHWFDAVEVANQFGYISFYNGGDTGVSRYKDTYQHSDAYYKRLPLDKTKITMNLGIKKMEPLGGMTSHLAVMFRATKGLDIRLGVFGHVFKLTNNVFQIKPYAVWRA